MSTTEFYIICALLVALPILFIVRFFMAIWSMNRLMGTRIKNGPLSWIALAVMKSEILDVTNKNGRR